MSVEISQPAKYIGLTDLLPPDLRPLEAFADELTRRLTVNHQAIAEDLAQQAVAVGGTTPSDTYESQQAADARMALQLVTS